MPPQGLNLNEYGIERGVAAPQVRNFAFLAHERVEISFRFIRFLFTRRLARLSYGVFFGGGGKSYVGPLLDFFGGIAGLAPLDPAVPAH